MSTVIMEKLDSFTKMAERLGVVADKIPRLAEMLGVALFAGRASERLGGQFIDGAIAGTVADGLAHSNLPNNQVGGIALGAYFAALGLLSMTPNVVGEIPPPDMAYAETGGGAAAGYPSTVRYVTVTGPECYRLGGTVIQAVFNTPYVLCRLPEE